MTAQFAGFGKAAPSRLLRPREGTKAGGDGGAWWTAVSKQSDVTPFLGRSKRRNLAGAALAYHQHVSYQQFRHDSRPFHISITDGAGRGPPQRRK
jgi:hypothetical protein